MTRDRTPRVLRSADGRDLHVHPSAQALDLAAPRRIHVVGVGGAGMSAIAEVLARMGHRVSGSDLKASSTLTRLDLLGVTTVVGHDAGNVPEGCDAVVVSSAIPPTNPEVLVARERGVPVLRRAQALRALVATRRSVAVAGSHGKTTTSSMLALMMRAAGWRPSFLIGGDVNEVGTNAAYDDGEWLVVEADESDGTFLELEPDAAIVTNVEPDHLDHYGGFPALVDAFERFLLEVPGTHVVCADDAILARLATIVPGTVTYGWADGADYRVVAYEGGRTGSRFSLEHGRRELGTVELPIPGRHNAANAAGAAAVALELGVPFDAVTHALRAFGGVARRFQFRGEAGGVTLVDDYAHLPSEVRAALRAAREGGWRRVVAVFQPHRYTRTASLWRDFADAFVDADALVLTDVYPAGEAPRPGVSGRLVLRAVLDAHPDTAVTYLPRRADVVRHALALARPGDVLLTLGAGDLTTVPDEWLEGGAGPGSETGAGGVVTPEAVPGEPA
ncbi:MAG TPA: UDP-N-acetylmuramate--L-alanine ligase [Acidimicrobiia bacterium]|nr:UDP-N-acetylmuramate--L-alanine ligase [Acidimicrobiia bacterium]